MTSEKENKPFPAFKPQRQEKDSMIKVWLLVISLITPLLSFPSTWWHKY